MGTACTLILAGLCFGPEIKQIQLMWDLSFVAHLNSNRYRIVVSIPDYFRSTDSALTTTCVEKVCIKYDEFCINDKGIFRCDYVIWRDNASQPLEVFIESDFGVEDVNHATSQISLMEQGIFIPLSGLKKNTND